MKKTAAAIILVIILVTAIAAGILWYNMPKDKEVQLYTYQLTVRENTYTVTVRTNATSEPEVRLPEMPPESPMVDVIFSGSRETVFCNVTVPTDLVGGEISVYLKDYKQDADRYAVYNNGTYNSIQMTFQHIAIIQYLSIRGTEGFMPDYASPFP